MPGGSSDLVAIPMTYTTCATNPPQPAWKFKGACIITKITSKGKTITLPAYKGIAISGKFPKNNAVGKVPFVLVDALDKNGDITKWHKKVFPAFVVTGLTSVIYAQAINGGTKPILLNKTPQIVVTDKVKLPGKHCHLSYLTKTTKGYKWIITPIPSSITNTGHTLTFGSQPIQFKLPVGPFYMNASCGSK